MALVVNPRDAFDVFAGATDRGDRMRAHIRGMIEKYDGLPYAPELGTYTRETNREWRQYALLDENVERADACPLKITRMGEARS